MTRYVTPSDPNGEFIGACLDIDDLLKRLTEIRNNHFGVDPDGQRNWGDVGTAKEVCRMLTEAVRFASGNPE